MPRGWLTPNSVPASTTCRVLFIPDDEAWIAIVTGALNNLVEPFNFEQYGSLTPQQTADALVDMFDSFCHREGFCRVIGEIVAFAGSVRHFLASGWFVMGLICSTLLTLTYTLWSAQLTVPQGLVILTFLTCAGVFHLWLVADQDCHPED